MATLITLYRLRKLGHGDSFSGWSRTRMAPPTLGGSRLRGFTGKVCRADWMISRLGDYQNVAERMRHNQPVSFEVTCPWTVIDGQPDFTLPGGHIETLTYSSEGPFGDTVEAQGFAWILFPQTPLEFAPRRYPWLT